MPLVGTGHIWLLGVLLIIVLIIWGPGKLPDVGSGMGRAIREFRKATHDTREEFAKTTSLGTAQAQSASSAVTQPAPPTSTPVEGQHTG